MDDGLRAFAGSTVQRPAMSIASMRARSRADAVGLVRRSQFGRDEVAMGVRAPIARSRRDQWASTSDSANCTSDTPIAMSVCRHHAVHRRRMRLPARAITGLGHA